MIVKGLGQVVDLLTIAVGGASGDGGFAGEVAPGGLLGLDEGGDQCGGHQL